MVISQTKGNINESVLSIDLIGSNEKFTYVDDFLKYYSFQGYGHTSIHPLNVKSGQITSLETGTHPNIFELTLLDIGLLHQCVLKLENPAHHSAYLIAHIYIYCQKYYE